MSHVVSPLSYRLGKTFLWNNLSIINFNNKQKLQSKLINTPIGLEESLDKILNKNNYYVVKTTLKTNNILGIPQLKLIYYPLLKKNKKKQIYPLYCLYRKILSKPLNYNKKLEKFIKKIWYIKKREFKNRFIINKKKIHLNKWFTKQIFRGSKIKPRFLQKLLLISNFNVKRNWRNLLLYKKNKNIKKIKIYNHILKYNNRNLKTWAVSRKYKLNDKQLSKQLSKRIGIRIQIKTKNIFSYLYKKYRKFTENMHQMHVWNKFYHFHKWRYNSFFDIVNGFYILSSIPNTEKFLIKLVQYGLQNMHKYNLKPKPYFYYIASIVKNMVLLIRKFKAIRFIVTGKLQGGTSRTKIFNIGFGTIPRQSLNQNIQYVYENLHSKYGSFGIKLLTWRKSKYEIKQDRLIIRKYYDYWRNYKKNIFYKRNIKRIKYFINK